MKNYSLEPLMEGFLLDYKMLDTVFVRCDSKTLGFCLKALPDESTSFLEAEIGALDALIEGLGRRSLIELGGSVVSNADIEELWRRAEKARKDWESSDPDQQRFIKDSLCDAAETVAKGARAPVEMLLWCPSCGERHVDRPDFEAHHTHACQHCGMVWRPAIGPTVGVQFLPGFRDPVP